ncbi:odorant receptor 10-like isoform X1 [Nomia melanderi]|uniref:odorant receptor 10-like isoform X1 n=1 Tax=Nomia melanderi TaxID=2448451 RepID=UPI003FCE0154
MHATCICANSVTLHNQFRLVPLGDQSLPSFLHVNTMRTPVVRAQITEKPRNPYYEQDIGHVLKHPRWILRSIGIWPILLESDNRIFPRFLIGFSDLVLLFTVVPFSLYVTFEEKDITMKLKLLGLLTFCTLSLLKHWALAACMPRIKDCVENLENDWKEVKHHEDRELMLKYSNVGRSLTLLSLVFMYTGGFMYHTVLQFAGGTSVDERNRTIKPLVYPTYSGMYNPQESPVYEMVYTVHCMCGYVIYSVTVGACGLAATFASHICGQIDVMILRLKNLVDLENKTERDQRLIQIVEHHIRTLRFSATVETLLQEVCFLEFVGSIFLICLLEYYILTDWGSNTWSFVTYFALLMSLMFNIFILCYIGDLLVEKTSDVGLSCFMTDWYKFPTDTIRALIMIIGMSSCPAKISAGQIVVLNLSTFGNILKTSLGYLSLLRTLV